MGDTASGDAGSGSVVLYRIEDRPPLGEAIPLGIQHVLAMFLGNVAPPLVLAGAVGSVTGETTFLVQMALGLGVAFRPEVLQQFPAEVQTLFGSALVTGGLSALLLNVVLPGGSVGTGPTEYTDGLAPETPTDLDKDRPDPASATDD